MRVLPPQLTAQNLARFMGEAGYCWILDDFHKLEPTDKQKLSQLMKVFMDMSSDYHDLKIICVGAVSTARQVIQYDSEMRNRVSEIKVPLMSKEEITEIIDKGFNLLNIHACSNKIHEDVYHYTNGLASICHKLCLLMCEALEIYQTVRQVDIEQNGIAVQSPDEIKMYTDDPKSEVLIDYEQMQVTLSQHDRGNHDTIDEGDKVIIDFPQLQYAVYEYLDDSSDTIKSAFDNAFQVDSAPEILEAISECGEEGASIDEIMSILGEMGHYLDPEPLNELIELLQTDEGGSIITYDPDSYTYRYTTPFLMTFARTLFEHSAYREAQSQAELYKILNTAFNSIREEVI